MLTEGLLKVSSKAKGIATEVSDITQIADVFCSEWREITNQKEIFMTGFARVLEAFKLAEADEKSRNRAIGNTAIASLLAACDNGFVFDFEDAIKLAKAVHLNTEPDIGAGALYNWTGLEDEVYSMEIAQTEFEESCRVADERRDDAWGADAASINREAAMQREAALV